MKHKSPPMFHCGLTLPGFISRWCSVLQSTSARITLAVLNLHMLAAPLGAQTSPSAQSIQQITRTGSSCRIHWQGVAGRTYFIQQSTDLKEWTFLPVIESGVDDLMEFTFESDADDIFVRLNYTDTPTSDPHSDDFDGDAISNWNEIKESGTGTNPLLFDTDADGRSDYLNDSYQNNMADGWVVHYFGFLGFVDPLGDEDGDSLSNLEENLMGSDPRQRDTDGDLVNDDSDSVWWDNRVKWPRSKEVHYLVIELDGLNRTAANYLDDLLEYDRNLQLFQPGDFFDAPASDWEVTALSNAGHVLLQEDLRHPSAIETGEDLPYNTGVLVPESITGSIRNHVWSPASESWNTLDSDTLNGGQTVLAVATDVSANGAAVGYAWVPLKNAEGHPTRVDKAVVKWENVVTGEKARPVNPLSGLGQTHPAFTGQQSASPTEHHYPALFLNEQGGILNLRWIFDEHTRSGDTFNFDAEQGNITFTKDNVGEGEVIMDENVKPGSLRAAARIVHHDHPANVDVALLGNGIWARRENEWLKVKPHPVKPVSTGRGVSQDFTVLLHSGKEIMRNGKIIPLSSLVLTSDWSDFRMSQMNDRGMMAGRAKKEGVDRVVLLVPLEIVQPKLHSDGSKDKLNGQEQLEVVEELRFARFRHGYVSDFDPVFRMIDGDRFYLRVPYVPNTDLTCKIQVNGIGRVQGGATTDPVNTVTLGQDPDYPGWLTSPPMFLVADRDDDTSYNGENTMDNAHNDASYLASEFAHINIHLSGDTVGVSPAIRAKRASGEVRVKLSYLSNETELMPHVIESLNSQFQRTRDVFRQIGIEVVQDGPIEIIPPNQEILDIVGDGSIDSPGELNEMVIEIFRLYAREDLVHCIFTDYPIGIPLSNGELLGFWQGTVDETKGFMLMNRREDHFVMAHELGHALGLAHTNEDEMMEPYKLMSPVSNDFRGDYKDGKRFLYGAFNTCKQSRYYESSQN